MDQSTEVAEVPPSSLRNSHKGFWSLLIVVGLVGMGAGGYLLFKRYEAMNAPKPVVVAEPEPVAAPVEAAVNVDEADTVLADASKSLTGAPEAAGWLAEPGMLRRLVAAVWQVSEGESPREPLRFLAPQAEYSVISRDGRTFQSPESEARYDVVARSLGAVNAAQAGAIYRRAQVFANAALKEISPAGTAFGAAVDKAIDRLAAVPLSDEPLEVVPVEKGVGYRFADPSLESLDRVQKHLLRMGPTNARIVVSQLKAFRAATRE